MRLNIIGALKIFWVYKHIFSPYFRKKLGSAIAGPAANSSGQGGQGDQTKQAGKHSSLPVDPYPYPGLKWSFHFITIDVTNIAQGEFGSDLKSSMLIKITCMFV